LPTLNNAGAGARLDAIPTVTPDACLFYCSQAFFGPFRDQGVGALTPAGKADDVWTYSNKRHPNDYYPPANVPVVFARTRASGSGDVGISVGRGYAAFTDYPNPGDTNICTIAERERQIGNPYLGWTEDYLGWDLSNISMAGYSSEPIENRNDEMGVNQLVRTATADGWFYAVTNGTHYWGFGSWPELEEYCAIHKVDINDYVQTGGTSVWGADARAVAPSVDSALIGKMVSDAIAKLNITAKVDNAAIAKAVDDSLADNFAAVNANVDQIPTTISIVTS
jgi:hypothetical protein